MPDTDWIGMTPRQMLLMQLDALAMAPGNYAAREDDRPGAIAVLREWAALHGYVVETHDLRPKAACICHEVVVPHGHRRSVIVVNQFVAYEEAA